MTGTERMRRWRSNPENRAKEQKREQERRAKGMTPRVRLTDEEKRVLRRIASRRQYRKLMADPVRREKWRADNRERSKRRYWADPEKWRARSRRKYAEKKALAEQFRKAENL